MLYTQETVKDNLRNREGKRVFYLVPEQVSAEVERALAKIKGKKEAEVIVFA